MDQTRQHNIQALSGHTQLQFSKKSTQIFLSISAFSILFSCSQLLPFFSQCISTFSVQLFTFSSDRNCIFLFCNGILVFLIRNSGLSMSTSPQSVPDLAKKSAKAEEKQESTRFSPDKEHENLVSVQGGEDEPLASQNGEEDAEDQFLDFEEEDEEGVELLSAEELNRKCDDFIRRMREGIKMEAQIGIMI
ncbi:hypothetical protein NMG60_11035289 [Bertholletia excelsa]